MLKLAAALVIAAQLAAGCSEDFTEVAPCSSMGCQTACEYEAHDFGYCSEPSAGCSCCRCQDYGVPGDVDLVGDYEYAPACAACFGIDR